TEHQAPGAQPADALEAPLGAQGNPRLARRQGSNWRKGGAQPDRVDRGQDGHQGHHPPQHRGAVQVASRGADVEGWYGQSQRVVAGVLQRLLTRSGILPVLQRLLTRSGILPVLRSQWRADQSSATDKLEQRLDKRVAELKAQIDRVADLADRLKGLEALADSVERITNVDREVRMLRATLAGDIADRHK